MLANIKNITTARHCCDIFVILASDTKLPTYLLTYLCPQSIGTDYMGASGLKHHRENDVGAKKAQQVASWRCGRVLAIKRSWVQVSAGHTA